MESLEFYAQLLFQAKMLGGPKELSKAQVGKLYEIRKKFGMKGKHPADICVNKGGLNCHTCGSCQTAIENENMGADLIAEITRKVMEQLGK